MDQTETSFDHASEHIAIIGMTGRFPGAKTLDEFWQNLREGVESIKFFTAEELAGAHIDPALLQNPRYVGADGIIEDMDLFDAEFFNIAPREAELMDPQHRLFLECAWEVMEQAGYDAETYPGQIAVYGSANLSSYLVRNILSNPELSQSITSFQTMLTNDKDFIATRVSYKMNLKGPSMSVATLCSSSFVAIHLGCQSLLNYQCDMALAGAISLQVSRNEAFFYQEGGIGDPDGHCRAFDAKASGTVSGSGIGIVALKRLEDAIQDGDHILAVIRGTAVNNDGAVKYSYTAPSIDGQADVIAEAISLAEVDPETITYVETHGTGTQLGDPIEMAALTRAFRGSGAQRNQYCAIGSVKTNIGHLVNAGGVASLIKTVLAMQHGQIPPSLNFETPNPEIDFANSPFYVNTRLSDWERNGTPRRAGVSSFGIGGTNVHILVEEAPEAQPSGAARPWQLLPLSAKTASALETQSDNLLAYFKAHPDANLADVAYTLQVGRKALGHRRMLCCRDVPEAVGLLEARHAAEIPTRFQETRERPVVFLFTGESAPQAQDLAAACRDEPAFRQAVDACAAILTPWLNVDVRSLLFRAASHDFQDERIHAACAFVQEYALAQLWLAWGVRPQAILGSGTGEYAAACLAGVFPLESALAMAIGTHVTAEALHAPEIALISTQSGDWLTAEEATAPAYWQRQVRLPLAETAPRLLKEPEQVLLVLGADSPACRLLEAHPGRQEQQEIVVSLGGAALHPLAAAMRQLWLGGVRVDWYGFHAGERRRRLPLPTYPFERQRYWIEPGKGGGQPGNQVGAPIQPAARNPHIDEWFYAPGWKSTPPLATADFTGRESGCWLLLLGEHGLGAALAERLRRAGQVVITAVPGSAFGNEEDAYTLNIHRRADYDNLLAGLRAADKVPQHVVHLWGLAETMTFEQAQDSGFYSLLFLAQALAGPQGPAGPVQLSVIANYSQKVESADAILPERTTSLGLCKVIPQENGQVRCRHIDIALPAASSGLNGLAEQILAEISARQAVPNVAYRGQQRWLPTHEAIRLETPQNERRLLRANGVYLFSGGLSDISLALAQALAGHNQPRLAILESEAFPPRAQWEQWLRLHGPEDNISRKIGNIRTLENAGAEVLVLHANLADDEQMRQAIAQISERFGAIHGLVHAVGDAGINTFQTILDTETEQGIRLFEARLRVLFTLERELAGQSLDFCLLVSSLASVLGGVGQAAYAAANIFLDAFAARCGAPWLSINWDAWQFEADQQRIAALTPRLAQFAIQVPEGWQAFERILAAYPGDRIIVSTGDLPARLQHWLSGDAATDVEQSAQKPRHPRPKLSTPYAPPATDYEKILADTWQATLGIDKIGIDDNFFDLGGDSLIAVKTITQLEKALQKKVPAANLYQTPSIRALAALLSQDEDESNRQRAAQLDERRETLSRRNELLHRKRQKQGDSA
ncbi:MAG: SDR family NAD(P)-dependent oxidoreductase [Chloroflexota bacterium]